MTAATGPSVIESTDPRNLDAERALLGSLLRSNDFYEIVSDAGLQVVHFYDQDNAEAFRVITEMLDAQRSATPITLANHIDKALLSSLCDARISPSKREVREWADDIVALAARRELMKVGRRLIETAVTAQWNKPTSEILADAEADLYRLEPEAGGGDGPVRFNVALGEAMDQIDAAQRDDGAARYINTGLIDLDEELGRLLGGQLVILAGRPGMGKSAFAQDVTEYNAGIGKHVAFFSMEMQRSELAKRKIARKTEISLKRQREKLTETEYLKISRAVAAINAENLPIFVDHQGGLTLAEIRARTRRLSRKEGLDAVVVDYLELMGDEPHMMNAPKNYQLGYITRGLKTLAKELDVPIFLLVQVNRKVEDRDDKRPHMSDLKDSGNIEQDADVVLFVYRDEVYLEREVLTRREHEKAAAFDERQAAHDIMLRNAKGVGEVIIAKNRNGEWPRTVKLAWDGVRTSFGNLARSRQS